MRPRLYQNPPKPPPRRYNPPEIRNKIFRFVLAFSAQYGYSPTIRQIATGLDIRSTDTTQKYVQQLVQEGRLERDDRHCRTLRPVL